MTLCRLLRRLFLTMSCQRANTFRTVAVGHVGCSWPVCVNAFCVRVVCLSVRCMRRPCRPAACRGPFATNSRRKAKRLPKRWLCLNAPSEDLQASATSPTPIRSASNDSQLSIGNAAACGCVCCWAGGSSGGGRCYGWPRNRMRRRRGYCETLVCCSGRRMSVCLSVLVLFLFFSSVCFTDRSSGCAFVRVVFSACPPCLSACLSV